MRQVRRSHRRMPVARVVSLLIVAVLAGGCAANESRDDGGEACPPAPSLVRGVGLSPRGMGLTGRLDPASLLAFYEEVAGIGGSAVLWNGAWRDDAAGGADAGAVPAGPRAVASEASERCFTPVPVFGWRSGEIPLIRTASDPANDWTNADARQRYASMLGTFAAEYQPPYVFLGNENDFYFEQAPEDYARWVVAYDEAYDAIKAASPQTLVGPVFNYEHLAGLGGLNGWSTPLWGALDAHDLTKVDIVGLSLYPFFGTAEPSAVPVDYLEPLSARIGGRPIAITETGWPAEHPAGFTAPWSAGEQAQVAYVERLTALLDGRDVRLANWLLLHALRDSGPESQAWQVFGSVSLRDAAGERRPAYEAWFARP
ncbi:MAG: hypothetical protein AB7L91_08310 [Dehalococcoidia bacterium]